MAESQEDIAYTIGGYVIFTAVMISLCILCAILTHLCNVICTHPSSNPQHDKRNQKALRILMITVAVICLFQITNLLTIIQTLFLNFEIIRIILPILDLFAHTLILIVLITRFDFCFNNTMFGSFDTLLRRLYIGVILFLFLSITTIFFMIFISEETYLMIVAFIFTEVSMQFMLLWLLQLFISKLFIMLNFSLKTVNPLKNDLSLYRNFRKQLGDNLSKRRLDEQANTDNSEDKNRHIPMDHDAEFVNIMSKMTLLVIIGVIGCMLSIFGHVFSAIHEWNDDQQPENNGWVILYFLSILFPICDRLMASFMLYLQFKQTEKVYLKLCENMDDYVLLCGLRCVRYKLKRDNVKYDKDVNIRTLTTRKEKCNTESKVSVHLEIPTANSNSRTANHGSSTSGTSTSTSVTFSLPTSVNLDAIVEEENVETPKTPLRLDMSARSSTYDMTPIYIDMCQQKE